MQIQNLSAEQLEFFDLICANKYALDFYFKKYGKDNVTEWMQSDWFIIKWTEYKNKQSRENELTLEQWNQFKYSSYDIIAKALKGDGVSEIQVSTAKWILSGEKSFIESRSKVLGEKSADGGDKRSAPVIELVRKKTD